MAWCPVGGRECSILRTQSRSALETARNLRRRSTEAEAALWAALRGRQLGGLKFRRQQPIRSYIVDFCCVSHLLVIELDGPIHADQAEYDQARTDIIEASGFRVIRFSNDDVLTNLPNVLTTIAAAAATRPPHPPDDPIQP